MWTILVLLGILAAVAIVAWRLVPTGPRRPARDRQSQVADPGPGRAPPGPPGA